MMKLMKGLLSIAMLVCLGGCANEVEPEEELTMVEDQYQAINILMDNLDEGENLLFSPLSLNLALGLCANGASEELREAFEAYFGMSLEEVNEYANQLIEGSNGAVELANAFYLNENLKARSEYIKTLDQYYHAECESVKFDEAFMHKANDWCNEKTHGMIKSILDEPVAEDTITMLLNALYFKGSWSKPYEDGQVMETEFTLKDGTVVNVEGMYSTENVYLENEYATGFMKYYDEEGYCFIGILPKKTGEFKFSELDVKSLLDSVEYRDVDVMLPKFEMNGNYALTEVLPKVGLGNLFKGGLTNIVENGDLSVSSVIQKTAIKVDEVGTEAAALTEVIMTMGALPVEMEAKEVYLNRPFAYLIYDTNNGQILFAGKTMSCQ
ncbi:MAG: serpin family protein [Erysipelotrichaceae bacterium]|nr:serpin family protein [Erysipelotrichaceae bacterium]